VIQGVVARRRCVGLALSAFGCGSAPPPSAPPSAARPSVARTAAKPSLPKLDPGQIVLGLRGHEAELHECFQLAGAESPSFVQLAWRVSEEGAVENVQIQSSTAPNAEVAPCLTERLSEARFGRPGSPKAASWTFVGGLVRFEDEATRRRNKLNARRKNKKANEGEEGVVIERSSPGKLDPQAVEGIVQNGYKLFAHCYRDGLDRDPTLGGAVRLRFVIGADGHVARVIDGGSDLPDAGVVACVAESFFALEFPRPAGGNVHLRYRVHFDAG
jgi:hypothetical protein